MGLPQHQPSETASSADPMQPTTAANTNTPTTVDQLPPAAIELATKLFDAARKGDTTLLSQYLAAGTPPNLTNHNGDTLLMLAAYHDHAETVQMLIERGADTNALNDRGQSPIAGAIFKGNDGVVKVLYEAGANLEAGQPSAIETAKLFRREEILKMFGVEA